MKWYVRVPEYGPARYVSEPFDSQRDAERHWGQHLRECLAAGLCAWCIRPLLQVVSSTVQGGDCTECGRSYGVTQGGMIVMDEPPSREGDYYLTWIEQA